MSACGYNDPEMLKAAIELAKSFSKAKGGGKNRAGGGGQGGRKEHFEPPQPRQQSRYGQIAAPPRQAFTPSAPSLRPMAPPPSRRNYGASGDFATRRAASRPVIGSLGREFLVSSGVKAELEPPKDDKVTETPVPVASQESQSLANKNSNGGTTKPKPLSTPPRSSGNGQSENILDAFYAILDKKPSIGQQIDTLAEALSKADLNDPGTPTLDTPPVKENIKCSSRQCSYQELNGNGEHEKACTRYMAHENNAREIDEAHNNVEVKGNDAKADGIEAAPQNPNGETDAGADVEPRSGPVYSHSRKLSPIAPVFVPRLYQNPEQVTDINEENTPSVKKATKGLLASMWA